MVPRHQVVRSHTVVAMDVRPATTADLDGIAAARLSNGPAHDDSGANPDYCRFLIECGHLWVAVDDHTVLGFGGAIDVGDARLLSDLYVHRDAHGRGVGSALLEAVLRGAADTFTFASSEPAAQAIYARAGMSATWSLSTMRGRAADLPPSDLVAPEKDVEVAAHFEQQRLGVDHRHALRYWASRLGTCVIAVEHDRTVAALGVVHVGNDTVRVEHLVSDAGRALDAFVAVVHATGASMVEAYVPDVRSLRVSLAACGFDVVETSMFMTSRPGVVGDDLQVVHPGLC